VRPSRGTQSLAVQVQNLRRVATNISHGNSNSDPNKNIQEWDSQNITTPGTANTAFTVPHNLGYVPTRFAVTYNNSSGNVYDSGVAWTATYISLKCGAASATIRLAIY
jgi:hypothetical protein